MTETLFPESELAPIAFELLASSTPSRYVRVARAGSNRLFREPTRWNVFDSLEILLPRAASLWNEIVRSDLREPEETELATILVKLTSMPDEKVDLFLNKVAVNTHRPAAWLGILARKLLSERPATSSVGSQSYTLSSMSPSVPFGIVTATSSTGGSQLEAATGSTDERIELHYR